MFVFRFVCVVKREHKRVFVYEYAWGRLLYVLSHVRPLAFFLSNFSCVAAHRCRSENVSLCVCIQYCTRTVTQEHCCSSPPPSAAVLQGLFFLKRGLFLAHCKVYGLSLKNDTCQSRTRGRLSLIYEERLTVSLKRVIPETFCIWYQLS